MRLRVATLLATLFFLCLAGGEIIARRTEISYTSSSSRLPGFSISSKRQVLDELVTLIVPVTCGEGSGASNISRAHLA